MTLAGSGGGNEPTQGGAALGHRAEPHCDMGWRLPCREARMPQLSVIPALPREFPSEADQRPHCLHEELKDVRVISSSSTPV